MQKDKGCPLKYLTNYTQSQKKCTINPLASSVTQGQGQVTPAGSYTLQNSYIYTFLQKKHNFPQCVSFETKCTCITYRCAFFSISFMYKNDDYIVRGGRGSESYDRNYHK